MTERQWATEVVRTLQAAGHLTLWAGGCVRDELLGLAPADYDLATLARPEQVMKLFRRAFGFGASFGVVEVLGPKLLDKTDGYAKVQVATFRKDGHYTDGRRPDDVAFSTPEEDAQRRDFTVNGLFLDPLTGEHFDYVGGRRDLADKVLRAIGQPRDRFREDKLRVLRAARMAARFGLAIDPATFEAAAELASEVAVVSAERIAEELRKVLAHPSRAEGVRLLVALGLLPVVLPEADAGRLAVLAALDEPATFEAALTTLLPPAAQVAPLAKRLKLANDERERLKFLAANRRTALDAASQPLSVLKPLLAHPGAAELLAVARAEAVASGVPIAGVERLQALRRDLSPAELDPPPLLTGDDLQAAGYAPGPEFKRLLGAVRAAQLDGELRSREEALVRAAALRPPPGP